MSNTILHISLAFPYYSRVHLCILVSRRRCPPAIRAPYVVGAGLTIRGIDACAAFRILKLCRYYYGSVLLGRALKKSVTALAVPIAFLLVLCVSIGGIMFSIEATATFYATAGAAKESDIPDFKGSYLGRFPLVSADLWTSDRLSGWPRSVNAFPGTRAQATLTLKRR